MGKKPEILLKVNQSIPGFSRGVVASEGQLLEAGCEVGALLADGTLTEYRVGDDKPDPEGWDRIIGPPELVDELKRRAVEYDNLKAQLEAQAKITIEFKEQTVALEGQIEKFESILTALHSACKEGEEPIDALQRLIALGETQDQAEAAKEVKPAT